MLLEALNADKTVVSSEIVYSIGGGDIVYDKDISSSNNSELDIYPMTELSEIKA